MANEKRLIDANAFEANIQKMFISYGDGTYPGDYQAMIHDETLVDVLETIEEAPTVDAVEVVNGHWTGKIICGGFAEEWGYKCSICGCTVSERSGLGVYQDRNQQLNYCPNCGAKMDGERRTDNEALQ